MNLKKWNKEIVSLFLDIMHFLDICFAVKMPVNVQKIIKFGELNQNFSYDPVIVQR